MNIFFEHELHAYLQGQSRALRDEIESQRQDYLLNVNEVEFVRHLADKYAIDPLILHDDQATITTREDLVPTHGRPIRKQVIRYHIPFSGDRELLKCKPSAGLLWTQDVPVSGTEVMLDLIDHRNDPDHIKNEFEAFRRNLMTQAHNSTTEVKAFNANLEKDATEALRRRKEELLRQANLVAALNVPLKCQLAG